MWLLHPCSGCKPLGVVLGVVLLLGLVLVTVFAVGRYSFTPSDALLQYNNAAEEWDARRLNSFDSNAAGDPVTFKVCRAGGHQQQGMHPSGSGRTPAATTCADLAPTSGDEGRAPAPDFYNYTSFYYETGDTGVLPEINRFECDHNSHPLRLALYTEDNTPVLDPEQSLKFPIFAYRWTRITDAQECRKNLGLYWELYDSQSVKFQCCVRVYVVDRVCITVNRTSDDQWAITPYKNGQAAGCYPDFTLENNQFIGCGMNLETWGYAGYTLVDGADIRPPYGAGRGGAVQEEKGWGGGPAPMPNTTYNHTARHLRDPFLNHTDRGFSTQQSAVPPHNPYALPPNYTWNMNLSSVKITIRSVYDPALVAEDVTGGTLSFDLPNIGEYAFGGDLLGFFGLALLYIGAIMITVSMLASLIIAALFPQLRYTYLYAAVHLDRMDRPHFVTYQDDNHPLYDHSGGVGVGGAHVSAFSDGPAGPGGAMPSHTVLHSPGGGGGGPRVGHAFASPYGYDDGGFAERSASPEMYTGTCQHLP